jgi:hypothetical protein
MMLAMLEKEKEKEIESRQCSVMQIRLVVPVSHA